MKVENMTSNNGNTIPNQFIIGDNEKNIIYFQSYESIIVKIELKNNQVFLDSTYWNYSKTTSKYRNYFLNESTKETKEKIKNGTYILKNLN